MKLKTVEVDGKTYAEVSDGKPLFVDDGGKEIAFDAPGTIATITRLNGEAKGHREAKEAAEKALKTFEGIEDPKKAIEALNTVSNLDAKKLIDAGEVEKVKSDITKLYEEKLSAAEKKAETIESQFYAEKIGGAFSRSKFITDKMAVPADVVQAMFGSRFKIEDGKTVAYDQNGNPIRSRANPAEYATFDEAVETLVDGYAHKDSLLKGSGGQGSGAQNSNGGSSVRTMTHDEFNKLPPKERAAKMAEAGFELTE